MISAVKQEIKKHNLLEKGDKVLVAVSGGSDSVALLEVLFRLRETLGIRLSVAHLDHMFRGKQSLKDAFFVEEYAIRLNLPVTYASVDIPFLLNKNKGSAQEVARDERYFFLERTCRSHGCSKIALGHHLNDQAETVLHNLLRGSGPEGLGGMLPKQGKYIRPLLNIPRDVIKQYCLENRLDWREDPSNEKTIYRRNKIRKELLPFIRDNYSPKIMNLLGQTAQIIHAENDYFNANIEEIIEQVCSFDSGRVLIDLNIFQQLHLAQKRRLLRKLVLKLTKNKLEFCHVERFLKFAQWSQTSKYIQLSDGLVAEKGYDKIILKKTNNKRYKEQNKEVRYLYELKVPGKVNIGEMSSIITADFTSNRCCDNQERQVVLDADKINFPLIIRNRKPGDRFFPLGAPGEKKLKDFFIDRKIPRERRGAIPLVVDSDGTILWVVGYEVNNSVKVTPGSKRFVTLKHYFKE